MLPIVLHPDVKKFVQSEEFSVYYQATWSCIDKLRKQQFDSGLRAKKLKGVASHLWEARITGSGRLLFTFNKSRDPKTQSILTYLTIQDICLSHDDVIRRARKISCDIDWLDANGIESENVHVLQENNERDYREIFYQEIKAKINESEIDDELFGNIQWRVLESEEEWQRIIRNKNSDLKLHLTPEEWQYAQCNCNLLLSGSAGSGKTTVGLYHLATVLNKTKGINPCLYITTNKFLLEKSKESFMSLTDSLSLNAMDARTSISFKTFSDLCLDILSNSGKSYDLDYSFGYQQFEEFYQKLPHQPVSSSLAWHEISCVIKSNSVFRAGEKTIMERDSYINLSKGRKSFLSTEERAKVYDVAISYNRRLKELGQFDETDLLKDAVDHIGRSKLINYHTIVCDEVQDLTDLHITLLLEATDKNGHLLLTGDSNQVITPSIFDWNNLKKLFYAYGRTVEGEKYLTFNFRSITPLVKLAQKILDMKNDFSGNPKNKNTSTYIANNIDSLTSARVIKASSKTLTDTLKELHPCEAILVKDMIDKAFFRERLSSTFVFTIEEAKGLEFDTVHIFNFFKDQEKLWIKALDSHRKFYLKKNEKILLEVELRKLYIAITRAQRAFVVWEEDIFPLWRSEEIITLISEVTDPNQVRQNCPSVSMDTWMERGYYFREKGYLEQSIECFQKAGNSVLAREIELQILKKEGKYDEVIQFFVMSGEYKRAANLLQDLKRWTEAIEYWDKCHSLTEKDSERKDICKNHIIQQSLIDRTSNLIKPITHEEPQDFLMSSKAYEHDFLENLLYVTPPKDLGIEEIITSWMDHICSFPYLLKKSRNMFMKSRYARSRKMSYSDMPVRKFSDQAVDTYQHLLRHLEQSNRYENISTNDLRVLLDPETKDVFSIALVTESKCYKDHPVKEFNTFLPWLEYLVVNPELLHRGIGKKTLQFIAADLGVKIASQIFIDSAGFFEKQGFKLVYEFKYNDADFYLAKNIKTKLCVYHCEVHVVPTENHLGAPVYHVSCSSKNNVMDALHSIIELYPDCHYVSYTFPENNWTYYLEPDGTFKEGERTIVTIQ